VHEKAIRTLRRCDERLRHAIRTIGPCTLAPSGLSPFHSLLSSIGHQQLHGVAAKAILGRFQALYGSGGRARYPDPDELLATPFADLRGVGLSRAKIAAFRSLAARVADGTVPTLAAIASMEDTEIVSRLTELHGVGPWTAQMLLIFTLGRPDVLPVDDFGIREGFRLLYGKRRQPRPRWLAEFGERWAPHRTVAAWYLWRYVEHARAVGD
jgi:DNA-3-methyladenine glycosylase II